MATKIVIVDYGLGNLYSISQACSYLGFKPIISSNSIEILNSDKVILPGVGAFKVAMNRLSTLGLDKTVQQFAFSGRPLMGICLGMQLLLDGSEEFGQTKGLGLIPGNVVKFPMNFDNQRVRIPHIGWNKVLVGAQGWANTPLRELNDTNFMYFVHSYYAVPQGEADILSYTYYQNFKFCSSVRRNNIYGFQFHPEKSAEPGLSIYKNFLSL